MSMTFRKAGRPRISREMAARQARLLAATRAAFTTADDTRAFLNNEHAALGGRPLDIALFSDSGLLAVERALRRDAMARGPAGLTLAQGAKDDRN